MLIAYFIFKTFYVLSGDIKLTRKVADKVFSMIKYFRISL